MSVDQNALFQRLRCRLLANAWRVFASGSMTRPLSILAATVLVWAFVFAVSWLGFKFLVEEVRVPPDGAIIARLISMLFFTLGGALVFSSALILHASLFNSAETAFLLSRPVTADHVFAYKFQAATGFSSWAFILLGCPVLITYGMAAGAPWWFYPAMLLFFLGFILLPAAVGALLTLLMANFLPNRRRTVLAVVVAACAVAVGWWIWGLVAEGRRMARGAADPGEAANALLGRMSFADSLALPSAWVTRGLVQAARGDLPGSLFQLALVWSNGLFAYLGVTWAASRLYRRGYDRLATGGDLRRKHGSAWIDGLLLRLLWFMRPTTRQLVLKDFRTFRRDPQQWGQVLLFLALLSLYFGNIRRMFVNDIEWRFQNLLSLLNLFAIALLLCTYTGRFVYPLLSLEGRKFWILGLLPVTRGQLLWGKFGFASAVGLLLALPMSALSDGMLGMPWHAFAVHALTLVALVLGLSGLSVGLGACMPNFKETDPSKIAVGFGGTVNLVAGLAYLVALVSAMAGPYHAVLAASKSGEEPWSPLATIAVGFGLAGGTVLALAAALVPMRAGMRTLREMEF
ncbi:MAG: hypothetical protein K2W96_17475 [Gemmataceae bacterium]|nr:hypothetical protein [Gemmataceae bacterium]